MTVQFMRDGAGAGAGAAAAESENGSISIKQRVGTRSW